MTTQIIRPAARPEALSNPVRDLFGLLATAGLTAGLLCLAADLSRLAPGVSAGIQAFLGLG